ncbi:SRPBCC family protein [Streptomyces poonensis]|uniref:Polyketide cyclase n=1 Tax=Streptomyces poonensis TaxID=68255 RepID=A0A918Q846_9ACTN|nr:SRPBCC family protein [Streptomyces poonensis]GGZ35844.1 polyketide cyclase [Streptomyces poonensis]GLJ89660.1 polyketide cyclase [Streptomyces poonensis]
MTRLLRPVGLDFTGTAPLRLAVTREMSASPDAVYRAMAEDVAGWSEWFPGVRYVRPIGDGAGREVRLKAGVRCVESVVAAEPGALYAYRVDETNVPGMRALLEEWRLTPAGTGTRVRFGWAADALAPVLLVLRLGRPGLARAVRDGLVALDRRLASV